jgi:arsenite methyltransferase
MPESAQDMWARWMLSRRFGGDPELQQKMLGMLAEVRDRVLSNAGLRAGEVLLDVGAGDGLIAFGALQQVGEQGRVIFSDISQDLLDHSRSLAAQMGVLERCRFLLAPAEDLSAIEDGSVDVVTTRSVLIFVDAKQRAFEEFYRVLRPGGRISLFEPINRFGFPQPRHIFGGYDVSPIVEIAAKVRAVYERLQPHDIDPMTNFDERDLMSLAERAGFAEVNLHLECRVAPGEPANWDAWAHTAPNPKVPSMEEAMLEALSPRETEVFVAHMRPLVEGGRGTRRSSVAYLWATKSAPHLT